MLAVEGPHGVALAARWVGSADPDERNLGWSLASQLALRDASLPDAWFAAQLAAIERANHGAPNHERDGMNRAVISIGCRNAALRDAALAAAARIGRVDVDHGDTWCETPDAAAHIAKAWAHSTGKGFDSPAAQERTRESPRTRC